MSAPDPNADRLRRAVAAIDRLQRRVDELEGAAREPIALCGTSCRFPGGANDPAAYWALLRAGSDLVVEVPPDRWDADAWYDPDPEVPGKMYAKWGGFLKDVDVRAFDPLFFGITPREAEEMDPQQRLLLELA